MEAVSREGHIICLNKYKGEQLNSLQGLEILATKKIDGRWSNNTADAKIEGGGVK